MRRRGGAENQLIRSAFPWLRGRPAHAQRRLDSLFAARPFESLGTLDERIQGLRAAALYAASGRPDRARSILTRVLAAANSVQRRALHSHQQVAIGEIALAEGRPQDALAHHAVVARGSRPADRQGEVVQQLGSNRAW